MRTEGKAIVATALLALAACGRNEAGETAAPAREAQAPSSASAAAPNAPPARKPGLWKQTVSTESMTQDTEICVDAATDRKLSIFGQQVGADRCSQNDMELQPGGWRFTAACDMGSVGKVTTTGVASGDFSSHYTVKAQTTTAGAAAPQMNGTRAMTLDAAWQGPCPVGMRAGDLRLPGGAVVNLLNLG